MTSKYIYFILIPVFFGLTSCAGSKLTTTEVFEFTTTPPLPPKPTKKVEKKITVKNTKTSPEASEQKSLTTNTIHEEGFVKEFNIGYLTFNVGDFYAEIKPIETTDTYTRYYFRTFSRSNAFIDYLFGWRSNTISVFRADDNGVYQESFQSKILLKKRTKELEIKYDTTGKNIAFEQVIPPDNRAKRPEVPQEMKRATYSPLALAFEAHRLIIRAVKEKSLNKRNAYSFTLPLYDSRRRSDINFTFTYKKPENIYLLKISEKAIAGFTNNELKDIAKGERTIELQLNNETLWPVSGSARSPLGSARANYIKDCYETFEDCIKPIKTSKNSAQISHYITTLSN